MHQALVREIVKTCRKRASEGDCPSVSATNGEMLEGAVIELADAINAILAADERGQGQPFVEAVRRAAVMSGAAP